MRKELSNEGCFVNQAAQTEAGETAQGATEIRVIYPDDKRLLFRPRLATRRADYELTGENHIRESLSMALVYPTSPILNKQSDGELHFLNFKGSVGAAAGANT